MMTSLKDFENRSAFGKVTITSMQRPQQRLRSIVMSMSVYMPVCLCVCLSARISPKPYARSLPNLLCMLPMSVARSASGTLTIGRIAYRREGVTGMHSEDEV